MDVSKSVVKSVFNELKCQEIDKLAADEVMRKAQVTAEIAKKEKGKKVTNRPSREYLLLWQLLCASRLEQIDKEGHRLLLNVTITSEHPPCNQELGVLRPILIKFLQAETVNGGGYIVLRYL
jgi:hypothetical protein